MDASAAFTPWNIPPLLILHLFSLIPKIFHDSTTDERTTAGLLLLFLASELVLVSGLVFLLWGLSYGAGGHLGSFSVALFLQHCIMLEICCLGILVHPLIHRCCQRKSFVV